MSSKIKILNKSITNKIAAGEVVERPASVVKELVENSIDAGSSNIAIEIENGGLNLIKVTDDGEGMNSTEAELAFSRHATSKIYDLEDLFNIRTLGFRGEALSSIAAVSKVEITTRTADELAGITLKLADGKIQEKEVVGCNKGTRIIIKDLFYNTPARLKFVKSEAKEAAQISNIMYKLILSNPHISFKLINDGKTIFNTAGANNLKDTLANLYGIDMIDDLIAIDYEDESFKIKGYVGKNTLYKANRSIQHLFINNRYFQNINLRRAIELGYTGMLPINRYPVFSISIFTSPNKLDVNVHPSKLEVKLEEEANLIELLTRTVRESVEKHSKIKDQTFFSSKNMLPFLPKKEKEFEPERKKEMEINKIITPPENTFNFSFQEIPAPIQVKEEREVAAAYMAPEEEPITSSEDKYEHIYPKHNINPIGQLGCSYIIAEENGDLFLIDQHAADERINYENIRNKYKQSKETYGQILGIPITLELSVSEAQILIENILLLNDLGIIIEEFGETTFLIRSLPVGTDTKSGEDLVYYLLSDILKEEKNIDNIFNSIVKFLACKKSIKSNKKLSILEMNYLIDSLFSTEFPYTCPHGRPTIIKITKDEIEKRFLRV